MRKIKCPLCNATSFSLLYPSTLTREDFDPQIIKNNLKNTLDDYRKHAQIVRCTSCGLVYTNPMENMKAILKGYKDVVDEDYLKMEKYRKMLSSHHLQIVRKFKKKGAMLDVGCFAGFFLELAKHKKWATYGIEPSKWAAKIARKRGVKIVGDDIESAELKPDFYDVVTMWDVIEHLSNPQKVIKIINKTLKPGGIIALGTPNIEGMLAKIMRGNYPYLIRMHIILYSPKTLRKLLEDNGFNVIHVSSYGRSYPLQYILERIKMKNILFQSIKKVVLANKKLANFVFHLDLKDEFVIIAEKTHEK